ncbi:somatomedin-B and thrombospondin type-1 domain-containing protein [Megalops cyprinoides]|uniref:somatomedin-B and thrombospondin type-1 domain-containing protein n=1 Tax=Megalops cyprinoides TaxID=118141 RepID=UPI001864C7A4|nr:somatomedin-B and thrombospondin type-1 domain-containing protein [Megalops cyprinoides]
MRGLSPERACLALLAALLGTCHLAKAGCLGKCCPGSDLKCTSTDWRMDRVYGTCFCDERCKRTKDCCFDYPTMCPAQPCAVSQWSYWSGCVQQCRPAFRVRRRHVEREAQNSGDACPPLEERAGCMEYMNRRGEHCAQTQGPALITTVDYGKGRPKHDLYGEPVNPGYCMEFKMESLSPHCMVENRPHARWMQYLREGYTVCVACQPPAMRNQSRSCQGDGATSDRDALLQWQAVGNPRCRGTWKKVQRLERCSCPQVHSFLFI